MDNKLPLCSIIVINYNGKDLLRKFLPSVINLHYSNKEIIVVDNASVDGSVQFIRDNFPNVNLVCSKENLGTAEGSNFGFCHAKGDYIFWLSNDMELEPKMLNYLIETAESDSAIGICTCKMRRITANGKKLNIIDSVGANVDIFGYPCSRGFSEYDTGHYDYTTEVFFSFGGAMLIKRTVLEKIGCYDKSFFTLVDDIDLCWRAHLAGYKVVVDRRAVLYHRVSATLGTEFGRSRKRYWSERNTLRSILKNYSTGNLVWILPAYLMLLFLDSLFFLLIGRLMFALSDVKAIVWNLKHLRETLKLRGKAQKLRKIKDSEIRKFMSSELFKLSAIKDFLLHPKNRSAYLK